jgi:type II secretory ATPase GspE/PulE/Tfp pilus assembly ATPase PilB-like protein
MAIEQHAELQHKLGNIRRDGEERDAKRRADKTGTPYVDLRKTPATVDALRLVPEAEARDARAAVLELKTHGAAVAAFDPASLKTRALAEALKKKGFTTKFFTCSMSGLEEVWRSYKFVAGETEDITGKFEITTVEQLIQTITSLQLVREEVATKNFATITTTDLFQIILAGALGTKASDIHFEAEEESTRIRYRLDGLLHDAFNQLPQRNYESLVSRIKLISGLKINIHGEPQDGRFTIGLSKKEIEVRVSIIPSEFGETIVMRILDPDSIHVTLDELGLRADDRVIVDRTLEKPNGLVLNTGPTGSGKTTTLYAFLRKIVNPETKIITVEDPIEYRVEGVEQTQTNTEVGYTFAGGLRAILRQDPDVILIGEIRDLETADIALQASLTGHLVFSTLHTNDAAGAVPRLIDLGVKASTIGPATSLVIAQRLVRKVCAKCRAPADVPDPLKKKIASFLAGLPRRVDREPYKSTVLYRPVGCPVCSNIGYKGRIGVYEFLEAGPDFEAMLLKESSTTALREMARKQNMVTMQEDGVLKVISGTTTFEEVEGVTGKISWL